MHINRNTITYLKIEISNPFFIFNYNKNLKYVNVKQSVFTIDRCIYKFTFRHTF
jgi:hypothetical protein